MNEKLTKTIDLESLLIKFNNRDRDSFGNVYSLLFKEIYYFHQRLYNDLLIDSEDLIQDIFLKIWSDKKLKFDTIKKLKSFIYISIANSYKNRYNRNKRSSEIIGTACNEEWYTVYAVEAEVFSLIPTALNMLPEDCAESFRLFIEGYSIKEIAEKQNKPLTTIYSQREKAVTILRKKLPKSKLLMALIFIAYN